MGICSEKTKHAIVCFSGLILRPPRHAWGGYEYKSLAGGLIADESSDWEPFAVPPGQRGGNWGSNMSPVHLIINLANLIKVEILTCPQW